MPLDIPDDWRPTAANINALPQPLRDYIHKLETHWDPAFTLQELGEARDLIAQLQAAIALDRAFRRTP
jgi:hypothetical protein